MQFPVAIPGEGLIDVVVQSSVCQFHPYQLIRIALPVKANASHCFADIANAGIRQYRWGRGRNALLFGQRESISHEEIGSSLTKHASFVQMHYYKGIFFCFCNNANVANRCCVTVSAYILEPLEKGDLLSLGESYPGIMEGQFADSRTSIIRRGSNTV